MVYNFCHCCLSSPQIFGTLEKREDSEIKKKNSMKKGTRFFVICFSFVIQYQGIQTILSWDILLNTI